ncbi:MAG: winged helix-turn-helix domain-containing protein [Thermoplasmatota archaeon]
MTKPYRSRSRLVLDIMRALRESPGGTQVTRLLAAANLTHPRLLEHLRELTAKGWIEEAGQEGRRAWRLTATGQGVAAELERMEVAMADFGLRL